MKSIREFHAATHKRLSFVIEHLSKMPAMLLTTRLQGFGKQTVAMQLNHILYTESAWVLALQNQLDTKWNHEEFRLPVLRELRREVADRTVLYFDGLTEEALHSNLESYPEYWPGPPRTPSFILHHVITHAFHHKGQIAAMCRILGHPLPDTDLQQG